MPLKHEGELCTVSSPLGEGFFFLRRFIGEEGISRPFHYFLDLVAEDIEVDFEALIGQSITLTIKLADDKTRFINGIVIQWTQADSDKDITVYHAKIVPWFWLLTRRSNCRIFQQKSIVEIISEIFDELGFPNYEFRIAGSYEPWDFCVQYRESDFDFVSRLMEQEGLFFFFEHEAKLHRLVIADSPTKNIDCPGQKTAAFNSDSDLATDEDCVTRWFVEQKLQPTKFALTDFTFLDPATDLQVSTTSGVTTGANKKFEIFDYPGGYVKMGPENGRNLDRGEARVKLLTETSDARAVVISGGGNCRSFMAGYRFELTGHFRKKFNQLYLITQIRHTLEQELVAGADATSTYSNEFESIPFAVPFRPLCSTPKPVIHGPQTAFVVGKSDEEIYTDRHGRVKVQFHWDRMSEADENSSCWIRVGQVWAGKSWGGMFVPRIGNEVIVEFINGDPDRPLITGSVYNAVSSPPFDMAAKPTLSGVKTNSSQGGQGFNEIRFDDKKGDEELFIHGQKNLDFGVENDRREFVGNDRHLIVEKDKFEQVNNNRHEKVDADHMEEIGKDRHLKVAGKEAKEVTGSLSLSVDGEVIQVFKANAGIEVSSDLGLSASNVVIVGMTSITLKVGGSSVVVDSSGVTLTGATVTLDGSMTNINSGPGSSPKSFSIASLVSPAAPEKPATVGTSEAGSMAKVKPHKVSGASSVASSVASSSNESKDDDSKKTWIEIELLDDNDKPIPGEKYQIELPDGSVAQGTLDEKGFARVEGAQAGDCKITFPNLDKDAWKKA